MKVYIKKYNKEVLTWLFKVMTILGSAITSLCKQIYKYKEEETKALAMQNNTRIAEANAVTCVNEISDFLIFEAKLLHEFGVAKDGISYMRLLSCNNNFIIFAIPKYNIHSQTEEDLLSRLGRLLNERLPLFIKSQSQRLGYDNFNCYYKFIASSLQFTSIQDNQIELIFKVHIHGA